MTRSALPKLRAYAAVLATILIASVALGRPELVALAAPFALFLALGLALLPAHDLSVELTLPSDRAVEGDAVELQLRLRSASGVARLELEPSVPFGLEADGSGLPAIELAPRAERTLTVSLRCRRWGAYPLGACVVRASDRFALTLAEQTLEPALTLRVYPSGDRLQRLVRPIETQPFAGNQVARAKGEGIEFADIRPFVPGDRVRKINWRTSARRQSLWVNESHPERDADIVLFIDTFAEARRLDESTLDRAVRAAASLAEAYLARRDRVGLVSFGGKVHWLTPASGTRQLHRIVEALLRTDVAFSYVWNKSDVLPQRTLPPQSLVLVLSPLLDERALDVLVDLRARGFDVAIVDVSPLSYVPAERGAAPELAHRLWLLWRRALLYRCERLGVPVVAWREDEPLAAAIEGVRSFRRYARRIRA